MMQDLANNSLIRLAEQLESKGDSLHMLDMLWHLRALEIVGQPAVWCRWGGCSLYINLTAFNVHAQYYHLQTTLVSTHWNYIITMPYDAVSGGDEQVSDAGDGAKLSKLM